MGGQRALVGRCCLGQKDDGAETGQCAVGCRRRMWEKSRGCRLRKSRRRLSGPSRKKYCEGPSCFFRSHDLLSRIIKMDDMIGMVILPGGTNGRYAARNRMWMLFMIDLRKVLFVGPGGIMENQVNGAVAEGPSYFVAGIHHCPKGHAAPGYPPYSGPEEGCQEKPCYSYPGLVWFTQHVEHFQILPRTDGKSVPKIKLTTDGHG